MNIIESLNRGLETKYHLNEAKEDKERFKAFVNDDDLYNRFEILKSKQIIKGKDADYTYWEKQPVEALRDFIEKTEAKQEEKNKEKTATKQHYRQISDLIEGEDYNFVYSGNGWTIYEILTHKASQWFGRDTKWCITMKDDDSYFNEYKQDCAEFYFLIPDKNPETNKWCYLYYDMVMFYERQEIYRDDGYDDYDDEDEDKTPTFWDAEDNDYPFKDSYDLMGLNIPSSVLIHLPGIIQKDINNLDALTANIENARKNGYVYTSQSDHKYILKINPTKVIIQEGVKIIAYDAFADCVNLKEVQISNGVKAIGVQAFSGCKSLQEIVLPDSLKEIGSGVFAGCTSLQKITLPDSVEKIGGSAFAGCASLKEINILGGVKEIGYNIFCTCIRLTKILLPNSVKEIKWGAFENCASLKEIIIPDSVEKIEGYAFRDCDSLQKILLPNNVKEIGEGAFSHCTSLKEIVIPNSVKEIRKYAFYYCTSLKEINLSDNIKCICVDAFSKCGSLQEIKIKGEYRPEMFKNAGLNDAVIIDWVDCGIKETWGDTQI